MLASFFVLLAFIYIANAQAPEQPCAAIRTSVRNASNSSANEAIPTVPAPMALDCLKSVPFDRERALELLYSLRPYAEFQSTVAFLKSPPEDYPFPAVDVFGEFQKVEQRINDEEYQSEYEYAVELVKLYGSTQDGHFIFSPDILHNALIFRRPMSLLSFSEDGAKLPQVYVAEDIRDSSDTASPVVSINGKDTASFLTEESAGEFQDPDALYNSMFFHANPFSTTMTRGRFALPLLYPGDNTTLAFENGTQITLSNFADVVGDFSDVDSGDTFFEKFCNLGKNATVANPSQVQTPSPTTATQPVVTFQGYPSAEIQHSDVQVAGYFPDDKETSELAVLSIPSFSDQLGNEFQAVVEEFLKLCKGRGKKKLVVDVQGNPGGFVALATDVFGQLFPGMEPLMAQNMRATEGVGILGDFISGFFQDADLRSIEAAKIAAASGYGLAFNARALTTVEGSNFSSWSEVFGPVQAAGDNFTTSFRVDFGDPVFASAVTGGITATGFGNRTGFPEVFRPEDVVLLTDGRCASTCSVLVNLLRENAGVRTVTVGGRPEYGPMQAVGGTRGPSSLDVGSFVQVVKGIEGQATEEQKAAIANSPLANLTDVPVKRSAARGFPPGINLANGIRLEDETLTPLQFVYQAANCRLFYRAEMFEDVSITWKLAAQYLSGDDSVCVEGSTGHPSVVTPKNQTKSTQSSPRVNGTDEPDVAREQPEAPLGSSDGSASFAVQSRLSLLIVISVTILTALA